MFMLFMSWLLGKKVKLEVFTGVGDFIVTQVSTDLRYNGKYIATVTFEGKKSYKDSHTYKETGKC